MTQTQLIQIISVNCAILPSIIPINGILLNLTSTSAVIGCATDDYLNTVIVTVTITCVSQDVWSHLHPTDLIEYSLPMETTSNLDHAHVFLFSL